MTEVVEEYEEYEEYEEEVEEIIDEVSKYPLTAITTKRFLCCIYNLRSAAFVTSTHSMIKVGTI